ncbi:DUF4097 family beta strand repeat-containing protein [Phytoactinopolyspora halotolerans]|uniref:DUF4097 domain-containing protein n=1 Tax=Phytoactinopolyspora halotolerans TaxID=1981512 RepID=A0A6L9SCC6_9ACTN|nr:DUF4097 family beta strand repeat-containing protein [Phytoactinopolyspora halotolerans]NEE02886.1 DUF4097 domain-containing protein [Phytoactinopolyspora halotolerans]
MTFEDNVRHQRLRRTTGLGRSAYSQRTRLFGAAVVVVTAVAAYSWLTRSSDEWSTTIANVSRIEVDIAAGDIELFGSSGSDVQLDAHTDDGWVRAARLEHHIDGETLRIEGRCSGNRFVPGFGCGTHVVLAVPDGVEVKAATSGGSIESTGLVGNVNLESSAGDVVIEGHSGELRAHSTAGDVTAMGLTSHAAYLTSSAGSVEVQAVSPPRSLDVESSGGPVHVELPAGHAYHVEASGVDGEATVDAATNFTSGYEVRAFSSADTATVTTR